MPDADDIALLREFAGQNSETAFAELVRRHINLVYSVARRFTGNDSDAQDVTQVVFIILARKAAGLSARTVLGGWLYETTRFTAMRWLRARARRRTHEQEASMQSILDEPGDDALWRQLAPHLETAMSRLNATDRTLLALRFYENKTGPEAAALLRIREETARKRTNRALEKLRLFFAKRGVDSTTAAIAGAISGNSIQVAPAGLAKTVSTVALAKGAAASTSTLTLLKGALKIMAWTNAKNAIVAGVVVLLAVAPAPIIVKEYEDHRTYSWELPPFPQTSDEKLWKSPPQVRIVPSKYRHFMYGFTEPGISEFLAADGTVIHTNDSSWQSIGIGFTVDGIVQSAYDAPSWKIIYLTQTSKRPLYDYISNQHNLPRGTAQPLRELIQKKFGIVGTWEPMETDVMVVKLANPGLQAFKPPGSLIRTMGITNIDRLEYLRGATRYKQQQNGGILSETDFNCSLDQLIDRFSLPGMFKRPVINETGLTNRYDYTVDFPQWNPSWNGHPDANRDAWTNALSKQLGLELVPAKRTVQMLVVEKAP